MTHQTIEEEIAQIEIDYDIRAIQRKIVYFQDLFEKEQNERNYHEDKMYEAREKLKWWERILYDREVKRLNRFK